MDVTSLRCEYRQNPLGIDVLSPRLSWQLSSDRRGARQSAYQIVAAATEEDLIHERGLLWDSGKVISDQSVHVPYEGQTLRSRQRVWWRVRVWDENDMVTDHSEPAWWEMGLLERSEWVGQWIGAALAGGPHTTAPCPYVRKRFTLDQPVASARLYVTALGLYEVEINGQRVGDDVFTPGWTDYNKRAQYQVYDVTSLLVEGENVVGAILGDGWYCGHVAWQGRQQYGDRPRFLAQLMVAHADGSVVTIATDGTWTTTFGPIIESDLLMGESYDARRELGDWSKPGFDDAGWSPVITFSDPRIALTAMRGPTVRRVQELQPIDEPREIWGWITSRWIFDLGQNMVGRVRLKLSGPSDATVALRHAEVLDAKGNLYTENLRTARQTDYYTLRGDGEEVYEPRFTFHGFRYVELSGYPGQPSRDTVTGIVLHSDTPPTGTFECSDPLLNQLQHNIIWGQKGNFLEVPTDCPQRDERLGWLGDAQVFISTAAFNMDVASFFTKWQQDLADSQSERGAFPPVAPNPSALGALDDGGPAWADAGVICPWTIYLCYGDTRLLEEHYPSFVRFLDFLNETQRDFIRCHPEYEGWHGFGDWLSIHAETRKDLIGTAFFAFSARLMAQVAGVLGKDQDAARYRQLFESVCQAFINRFVTPDGLLASDTQTAYVLALHFDLLAGKMRETAVSALVEDVRRRGNHLSTGFVGSPYLPRVLAAAGRLDVAYELLQQKSWPSWLYAVTQGATTIWERWDGWTHDKGFQDPGMNSFNHYAYGAIGAWLYATVAGIDVDPEQPGYKHVRMQPQPGGGLTHASATYESVYGRIASAWRIENDAFSWEVTIPPNTTATVVIPAPAAATVYEGGALAEQADGITVVERGEATVTYKLVPGAYHFAVRNS